MLLILILSLVLFPANVFQTDHSGAKVGEGVDKQVLNKIMAKPLVEPSLIGTSLPSNAMRVYVGTYTDKGGEGIYVLDFNPETGELGNKRLACKTENPSFLAQHPTLPVIYAVGEVEGNGTVSAFNIDTLSGLLTTLSSINTGGAGPCHVSVATSGKYLAVANYGGGSVATINISNNGALVEKVSFFQHKGVGVIPDRQEGPHAHSVDFEPGGNYLLCADLGLDKVMIYKVNQASGSLKMNEFSEISLEPGNGPRHIAFHPSGKFLYILGELGNAVSAFDWDAENGMAKQIGVYGTLPKNFNGTSYAAEITVHASGKFLYASNRGFDSIAIFGIDESTGKLSPLGHALLEGQTPRHFSVSPGGEWLLAGLQNSGKICVLHLNTNTGKLSETKKMAEIPNPVCVLFARK